MHVARAAAAYFLPKSLLGMTDSQKRLHLKRYEKRLISLFDSKQQFGEYETRDNLFINDYIKAENAENGKIGNTELLFFSNKNEIGEHIKQNENFHTVAVSRICTSSHHLALSIYKAGNKFSIIAVDPLNFNYKDVNNNSKELKEFSRKKNGRAAYIALDLEKNIGGCVMFSLSFAKTIRDNIPYFEHLHRRHLNLLSSYTPITPQLNAIIEKIFARPVQVDKLYHPELYKELVKKYAGNTTARSRFDDLEYTINFENGNIISVPNDILYKPIIEKMFEIDKEKEPILYGLADKLLQKEKHFFSSTKLLESSIDSLFPGEFYVNAHSEKRIVQYLMHRPEYCSTLIGKKKTTILPWHHDNKREEFLDRGKKNPRTYCYAVDEERIGAVRLTLKYYEKGRKSNAASTAAHDLTQPTSSAASEKHNTVTEIRKHLASSNDGEIRKILEPTKKNGELAKLLETKNAALIIDDKWIQLRGGITGQPHILDETLALIDHPAGFAIINLAGFAKNEIKRLAKFQTVTFNTNIHNASFDLEALEDILAKGEDKGKTIERAGLGTFATGSTSSPVPNYSAVLRSASCPPPQRPTQITRQDSAKERSGGPLAQEAAPDRIFRESSRSSNRGRPPIR
jgi:hypothetical protein